MVMKILLRLQAILRITVKTEKKYEHSSDEDLKYLSSNDNSTYSSSTSSNESDNNDMNFMENHYISSNKL